jgi:hypothetical protein
MTVVRQRIETSVPRKRKGGTSGHDKVRRLAGSGRSELTLGDGQLLLAGVSSHITSYPIPKSKSDRHRQSRIHQGFGKPSFLPSRTSSAHG